MYLHIGKDTCLDERKVIGIFDINVINKNKEYKENFEDLKKYLIDISDGMQKTIILVNDEKTKGYITNISSITLKKRNI